ncbi:MAG: ATP-dependent zinc metalloprotease FtsH [Prevotellaceae bacterium]|jgi:cell division protease FtsH|nr:ATP-dependent zinc metalloprotease FtsH [Prevotellaceae bacterium]
MDTKNQQINQGINPKQPLKQRQKNSETQPKKPKFNIYWLYLIVIAAFAATFFWNDKTPTKEVSYSVFEQNLSNDCVKKITVFASAKSVEAEVDAATAKKIFGSDFDAKDKETFKITTRFGSIDEFTKKLEQLKKDNVYTGEIAYKEENGFISILFSILPFLLIFGFFILMSRNMGGGLGGIFNVGKSKAQIFDKKNGQKITFKDVAGLEGAKQEVQEIVEFLKQPQKYTELGGKIPKGALLVGPPGTGKTLLAKAVAGEADVPFYSLSGSDFVEMFVGVGASRVRDLFRQAKSTAPCIIFIDEIDAIGRARGKNPNMNVNDERENTLNQLLTEMDGFGSNSGVIILAATNRADILDKALLRAGRFDRQIHVDLPDVHERKEIFDVHLRPLKLDNTIDKDFLARQTPGFSGADIANVCNEAALIAARGNKKAVGKQDFLDAVDRIVGGLEKKTKIMTVEEKRSVAFHEAGHATVSWMTEHANPLVKVTIVPRGMALGAAWYLPEERQLTTAEHILDEVCALLGGRAAENVFFNTASTGALNDLERATKQIYAMVAYYGMSPNLPNVSYYDSAGAYEYGFTKPYSENTGQNIDAEVKKIINEQFEHAKKILQENEAGVRQIAQILIEKEVLFSEDVKAILGERPWKSRGEELLDDSNAKNN